MRVLLVIPGLVLLFASVYCVLGKDVVPRWVSTLGCVAGFGAIVYGAGRRKF